MNYISVVATLLAVTFFQVGPGEIKLLVKNKMYLLTYFRANRIMELFQVEKDRKKILKNTFRT